MVLVVAGALDLHGFAVQEETLVGIEADRPHSEGRFVAVHRSAGGFDGGHRAVHVRRFERPERRLVHDGLLAEVAPAPGRNRGGGRADGSHVLSGGVHNGGDHATRFLAITVVVKVGRERDERGAGLHLRGDESSPVSDVQGIGFHQPDVAVDACALVKPAFVLGGIHAHHQNVFATVVGEVRYVVAEWRVAAQVASEIVPVERHDGVAEHAVEFDRQPPAEIARRDLKHPPIPSDAGCRVRPAQRLRAVADEAAFVLKRQFHGEIVRQVNRAPLASVEILSRRHKQPAGLGKHAALTEAEILGWVIGVAEVEAPSEIEQQPLSARGGRAFLRDRRAGGRIEQPAGRLRHQCCRCCRSGNAQLQNVTPGPGPHSLAARIAALPYAGWQPVANRMSGAKQIGTS